jgi:hypothetical protein
MLWIVGAIGVYTVLSFAAAIIASQIMAIVHGTPVQAALEERCRWSWYRIESWLGYHPLNHRAWFAMATFPAMPPEAVGKQRTLRIIVAAQVLAFAAAALAMVTVPRG